MVSRFHHIPFTNSTIPATSAPIASAAGLSALGGATNRKWCFNADRGGFALLGRLAIGSIFENAQAGVDVGHFADQQVNPLVNAGFESQHPRFKAAHARGERVEQKPVANHTESEG
jgi:hypothetical protein